MTLKEIFTIPRTIAIVGLSDKQDRYSYKVGRYLKSQGFKIIPVNPNIQEWLGTKAFSSISEIPTEIKVDVVDIFRKSEDVPVIVDEVVETKRKPLIWMQEGVFSKEAKDTAEANNMKVVMDTCIMKTHQALI
jgi:predicted CoA-binding protein